MTIKTVLAKIAKIGRMRGLITAFGFWLSPDKRQTGTLQMSENKSVSEKLDTNLASGIYAVGDIIEIPPTEADQELADNICDGPQPTLPSEMRFIKRPNFPHPL